MSNLACSFVNEFDRTKLSERRFTNYAIPFANVILGISTDKTDVGLALRHIPQQLVPFTSTLELAVAFSDAIVSKSATAASFAVSAENIADFFDYAYTTVFATSEATRIGAAYVSSMQRLLYNTTACTISHFVQLKTKDIDVHFVQLRNATKLLVELATAVKRWLPNNSWLRGWTGCHALLCCIEFTEKTVLFDENTIYGSLEFRHFADQLFASVLKEGLHNELDCMIDVTNSFSWCASSRRWRSVIYNQNVCPVTFEATTRLAVKITDVFKEVESSRSKRSISRPVSPVTTDRPRHKCSRLGNALARSINISPPLN
tara:strand:- start:902 stop:1852 length:951 start_codon:yes stop_codon:yes gene_type:complete